MQAGPHRSFSYACSAFRPPCAVVAVLVCHAVVNLERHDLDSVFPLLKLNTLASFSVGRGQYARAEQHAGCQHLGDADDGGLAGPRGASTPPAESPAAAMMHVTA